jgi:plasmid stabilization system protein ParE
MNAERGFELHTGAASDITSTWEFIAKDNPVPAENAIRRECL